MSQEEAIALIKDGINPSSGTWADIGAGTGAFTEALREILSSGTIYAFDKNPHMLWRLESSPDVAIQVIEGDFTRKFDLPTEVAGIVMANALHYAEDPLEALQHVLAHLAPGGTFVLIEYNTDHPNPPYVPFPLSEKTFRLLATQVGLKEVEIITRKNSIYQGEMYVIRGKM